MSEKVEKGRLKKYGKEYGKYAACVVTGFALYGAAEVNRKLGDPARSDSGAKTIRRRRPSV